MGFEVWLIYRVGWTFLLFSLSFSSRFFLFFFFVTGISYIPLTISAKNTNADTHVGHHTWSSYCGGGAPPHLHHRLLFPVLHLYTCPSRLYFIKFTSLSSLQYLCHSHILQLLFGGDDWPRKGATAMGKQGQYQKRQFVMLGSKWGRMDEPG